MVRSRAFPLLLATVLVALPASSGAIFHVALIDELMSGAGAAPDVQFVEIRTLAAGQNHVKNTRLTAFSCTGAPTVLLVVPSDVPNSGNGVRWLMATSSFEAAAGIAPDFTFPAGIPPACGMVCWGAPGISPPDPGTWNPANPDNYVDCVAYGPYTGPTRSASGMPTTHTPGNGTQSLTRTRQTDDNAADFALAAPTPTNNSGQVGHPGGATTTTVPSGRPTTTTLPAACESARAMVTSQCDCATAGSHKAYLRCVTDAVGAAARSGTIEKVCKSAVRRCAVRSACGRSGAVACCRTSARGVGKCVIKRSASSCRAPRGGTAGVGARPSCCDACPAPGG